MSVKPYKSKAQLAECGGSLNFPMDHYIDQSPESLRHVGTVPADRVSIITYFKYGYSYPEKIQRFLKDLIEHTFEGNIKDYNNMWKGLPIQVIPQDKIFPTIRFLPKDAIQPGRVYTNTAKPQFVHRRGYYYLIDGHKRTVSMILNGQEIRGRVLNLT